MKKPFRNIPKGLFFTSVGWPLLSSNLLPLNELETSEVKIIESPHKKATPENEAPIATLKRELQAIEDFITYYEAGQQLSPEKGHNFDFKPSK